MSPSHLRPLLQELLIHPNPAVLATLVEVRGSTYRRPGARMVLHPDGSQAGVISAGCLEQDLAARVVAVIESDRPQLVQYDLGSELDLVWGTGMGCQGEATILLSPVCLANSPLPWASRVLQALEERRSGVLLTCFASPDPGRVGVVTWWDPDLSHPHLDPAPLEAARRVLAAGRPEILELGEDRILAEPLLPPPALFLFGAGEPCRPLATLAQSLGWDVGILDHRPALAHPDRFPGARWVASGAPVTLAAEVRSSPVTAAVVMSHVWEKDKEMLRLLLDLDLPYVGLQGNRRRSAKLLAELAEEGFPVEGARRERLHAPMGLDLGAESPEAIALSVMAELHAVLYRRSGQPLRNLQGTIHG